MKISLKFQDKTVTATLIDNETARDVRTESTVRTL